MSRKEVYSRWLLTSHEALPTPLLLHGQQPALPHGQQDQSSGLHKRPWALPLEAHQEGDGWQEGHDLSLPLINAHPSDGSSSWASVELVPFHRHGQA